MEMSSKAPHDEEDGQEAEPLLVSALKRAARLRLANLPNASSVVQRACAKNRKFTSAA